MEVLWLVKVIILLLITGNDAETMDGKFELKFISNFQNLFLEMNSTAKISSKSSSLFVHI